MSSEGLGLLKGFPHSSPEPGFALQPGISPLCGSSLSRMHVYMLDSSGSMALWSNFEGSMFPSGSAYIYIYIYTIIHQPWLKIPGVSRDIKRPGKLALQLTLLKRPVESELRLI